MRDRGGKRSSLSRHQSAGCLCGSMRRADGFRGADGLEVAQGVGGAEVAPELLDALLRHALAQREPAEVMVPARGDEGAVALGARGPRAVASIEALAAEAECVLTCLPRPVDVTRVLTAVLRAARPETLVVETSTIDPETSRRLAAVAAARRGGDGGAAGGGGPAGGGAGARPGAGGGGGGRGGAAPGGGRRGGPPAGTLTVLVGGEPAAVARARPVLEALGAHVHHLGPAGSGHLAKLCNQIITGTAYAAVAEALVLGVKGGLDPPRLVAALSTAS